MRMFKQAVCCLAVIVVVLSVGVAQADVFNMGGTRDPATGTWTGLASLEMVPVGDPGNVGELSGHGAGGYGPDRICGAVGYSYNIGKYEVTAGQYTEFLNAKAKTDPYGLYNTYMGDPSGPIGDLQEPGNDGPCGCNIQRSGSPGNYTYSILSDYANRPVNYVSYWDACRFVNWLGNGQGNGDTETGAYTLNGYNGSDGRTIARNPGVQWVLPNEDEWYKASYYKGSGTNAGYWKYPTSSDTAPGRDLADAAGNNANYYTYGGVLPFPIDSGKYTTVVGEFQNSASPYGTFDQGGNVYEWNETGASNGEDYWRGSRGSSFNDTTRDLSASFRDTSPPMNDYDAVGFRVASIPTPEPGSIALIVVGAISLLAYAWRNRSA
jgi:formylglycine-generating enzyme